MQSWSESNSQQPLRQHFNKVILYTLVCFSLAGLISGFAIGGFQAHTTGKVATSTKPPVVQNPAITPPPAVSATATPEKVELGLPIIGAGDYTYTEHADGASHYTLAAQIVNKGTNTPIQARDVTCRLWLTKSTKATQAALSANSYALPKAVTSFQQPFPAEATGMTFIAPARQVQPCTARGKTTWTYTLPSTFKPGVYYLAVISDWKGKHYNWYMAAITVQ